jgi:two-component system, cell cycle sensor histidine kinase and response regulator CckA
MFALCLGFGAGCLAWHHFQVESANRAIAAVRQAAELPVDCAKLDEAALELFSIGLEPPQRFEQRRAGAAIVRGHFDAHVATLRAKVAASELPGMEREIALRQLDSVSEATFALADAAGQAPPDTFPPGAGPPRDRGFALHSLLRERLKRTQEEVEQFRDQAGKSFLAAIARREAAVSKQRQGWLAAAALFLAIAAGVAWHLRRAAAASRVAAEERAAIEAQLREADVRFHSLFDHAIEGVFQATPEGRLIRANPALARMYGYSSPESLLASVTDIASQLYVEQRQRTALLEALRQEDFVSNFEIEVIRADGRTLWIRENVHAVRDASGQLLYLEGTVEDVSDRWWGEQRRRLQFATARALERAASVAEARPMILQTICEILDWDMGAIWDVDAEAGVLSSVEVWHAPEIDLSQFEEQVSQMTFMPGSGLAGEVWESGEPKWIANLAQNATSPSAQLAVQHGMGSAFGVPIKVNGAVRHVAEFFSPSISLPDPELLQTLGLIANQLGHIIERKTSEEALRKSEMRKAAILHSALDCIISFDGDGRIVEFNPAAEHAFGYRKGEALGRDISELIVQQSVRDEQPRNGHDTLFSVTNPGRALGRRIELVAVRSDGREFPAEVAVSRIKIDGRLMFTAYLRDISERKEAERITSELAAVVANSNDAIVGCTLDGVVRSWNLGAERIYGYSARDVIGRPLHMLIPPERLDEFPEMLTAVRRGESRANYETIRLRKDGKRISVSLTDSPIRGEGGRVTGLSSIARDITERKRLEEELLQSQKMEAVGRLAGGIAHDFNNILTAILGYSDLLIGQIEERHWMYKHLAEIRKAADFAASLTQQLLAFSRRQPLYLRVFCINDTVRNLQKMLQRVIGEDVRIQAVFGADVGRLKADPSQLEQVLLNLCVNARDAMPGGGTITISTADVTYFPPEDSASLNEMPAGEYVKLTVADTGTGIPPEVIKHIFEPFFTTKEKGQGTGLGLATCYGIVKQSGGYITVDSKLGEGTAFAIYLPRVDASGEKAQVRKEVGQLPGGSETILYVEDELSVRSLTSHVLRRLGYTVLEAGDAEQARAVVRANDGITIDLLFSDVVLPDVGGKELADWVLRQCKCSRVLFTSGYTDERILCRHGVGAGTAFLQKPFSPSDLAKKVREVIDEAPAVNGAVVIG